MKWVQAVFDRSTVLLIGVVVGTAIGFAFGGGGDTGALTAAIPVATSTPLAGGPGPANPAGRDDTPEITAARFRGGFGQLHLKDSIEAGTPIRVGVFGDSYGDGVWSAMLRLLPKKDGYDVQKYSKQSTGFTRYRQLNLEEQGDADLAGGPLDIAIISLGANDVQGVIGDSGKFVEMLTPDWQRIIGDRVDRFVGMLRRHGAMVYWVGLPRMREGKMDAKVAAINSFFQVRAQVLGVPFIDTRPFVSDKQGQYAAYLDDPDSGKQILIRAPDGVHMSMTGYVWISRTLADRIKKFVAAGEQALGKAPRPSASPTPGASPSPSPSPSTGGKKKRKQRDRGEDRP